MPIVFILFFMIKFFKRKKFIVIIFQNHKINYRGNIAEIFVAKKFRPYWHIRQY